mmetsp:Transcript_1484/g.2898  ORF Transcript_1484/g.2898 Transcript_1484/m.2898 type:complete len:89 (-) Transcript_1484:720-986(-)
MLHSSAPPLIRPSTSSRPIATCSTRPIKPTRSRPKNAPQPDANIKMPIMRQIMLTSTIKKNTYTQSVTMNTRMFTRMLYKRYTYDCCT